jgi:hypothetical protein
MNPLDIWTNLKNIKKTIAKDYNLFQDDKQYQENVELFYMEVSYLIMMMYFLGENYEGYNRKFQQKYVKRRNRLFELMNIHDNFSKKIYIGDIRTFYEVVQDDISNDI